MDGVKDLRIFKACNAQAFRADPAAGFARLFAAGERVLRAPDGVLCVCSAHSQLTALARQPWVEGVAVSPGDFALHRDPAAFFGAGLFAGVGPAHRHARRAALVGPGVAPAPARAPEIAALVEDRLRALPMGVPLDLARDLVLPLTAQVWARVAGYPAADAEPPAEAVAVLSDLSDPEAEMAAQAAAARHLPDLPQTVWQAGSPFMRSADDALPAGANPVPLVASMAADGIDSAVDSSMPAMRISAIPGRNPARCCAPVDGCGQQEPKDSEPSGVTPR